MAERRPDQQGPHRTAYEKNRKRVMASETVCGICGKPVDKTLKPPDPLAPCIDHIVPISRGGHPSDRSNLQLAHWCCNRQKSDKISAPKTRAQFVEETISNRLLPQTLDWAHYRPGNSPRRGGEGDPAPASS